MKVPSLSPQAVREIEETISYTFVNKSLLYQAFRRSSYCNEVEQITGVLMPSNEILEFCGDSVLGASVVTALFQKYARTEGDYGVLSGLDEGMFSTVKSNLSDKSMLSRRMDEMGLHRYLFVSRGDRDQRINDTPSVKEDLFESILGAVYLDSGSFDTAMRVVRVMLDPEAFLQRWEGKKNAKNRLQEICQARRIRFSYRQISVEGRENDPTYKVVCILDGDEVSVGEGHSRKAAEMEAASRACLFLESTDAILKKDPRDPREAERNPIQVLKEWNDRKKRDKAEILYRVTKREENERPYFSAVCVFLSGGEENEVGQGEGYSTREAKRAAAAAACDKLSLFY